MLDVIPGSREARRPETILPSLCMTQRLCRGLARGGRTCERNRGAGRVDITAAYSSINNKRLYNGPVIDAPRVTGRTTMPFQYAAKVICGLNKKDGMIAHGIYETVVNI